jgi:hypothetical protein
MGFGDSTGSAKEVDRFSLGITLVGWRHQMLFVLGSMVDE